MMKSPAPNNPFLRELLLSAAALAAVLILSPLLYRYLQGNGQLLHILSLALAGGCATYAARNILAFLRYTRYVRTHGDQPVSREEFLTARNADGILSYDPIQMVLTVILMASLLILMPVVGNMAPPAGGVSAEDLAGHYEVTEIKGNDDAASALQMLRMLGRTLILDIDGEGNGRFSMSSVSVEYSFRFYPKQMRVRTVQDGVESSGSAPFTWEDGKLVINGIMYFRKLTEEEYAALQAGG